MNNQPIQVRKNNDATKLFGACGTGMNIERYKKFIDIKFKLKLETSHPHCAVYNFAKVAAGNYDFSVLFGLALWDIAASWILVEETGGVFDMIDIDQEKKREGNPYVYWPLAGNKSVVDKLKPEFGQIISS